MAAPDPLLLGMARAPVVANHPRRPWLAAALALLCPGLGHFYCGANREAFAWTVAPHLALLALMFIGVLDAPHLLGWFTAGIAAWVGLRLVQVALAWRQAARAQTYVLRPTNAPPLYIAFFLGTSIFTSLMGLPFRDSVLEPFKQPSSAMQPTLAVGDQFFAVKVGPHAEATRGRVVLYTPPAAQSPSGLPFVGRVIAVAGETVELKDGVFYVNGAEQVMQPCEPADFTFEDVMGKCFTEGTHRILRFAGSGSTAQLATQTVPPASVFVVADNRDNALDSRDFGPVPTRDVLGRVVVVWMSRNREQVVRPERIGLKL